MSTVVESVNITSTVNSDGQVTSVVSTSDITTTVDGGTVGSVNGRMGAVTGLAEQDASNITGTYPASWRTALSLPRLPRALSTYTGTDPTGVTECGAAIQAALTAWGGTYEIIVDGTFKIGTRLSVPNGTVLTGSDELAGFTTTVTSQATMTQMLTNTTTDGTASGFRLRGLRFTGGGDGTPWGNASTPTGGVRFYRASDVHVDGCTFTNVPGQALNFSGCSRFRATNNYFSGIGRDGIDAYWAVDPCKDGVISGNVMRALGDDCIAVWSDSSAGSNGTQGSVTTTAGSAALVGTGTAWSQSDVGATIAIPGAGDTASLFETTITVVTDATHVTLAKAAPTAVTATATWGFVRCANITIVGNTIEQATVTSANGANRGIVVNGEDVTVQGNTVLATFGDGISVRNGGIDSNIWSRSVSVVGNTVRRGGYWGGLSTQRDGVSLRYSLFPVVSGNTIVDANGDGIYVTYVTGAVVQGNSVVRAGQYGVDLVGVSNVVRSVQRALISGNHIADCQQAGIFTANARYTTIDGNVCVDNGQSGAATNACAGINCTGSGDTTVTGNRCTDTRPSGGKSQQFGIVVNNSSAGQYLIAGNYCAGNASTGLFQGSGPTYTVGLNVANTATSDLNAMTLISGSKIIPVSGTPEGSITAPVGSLALRSDGGTGTSLYVKESGTGNTGWVAVDQGAAGLAAHVAAADPHTGYVLESLVDAKGDLYAGTAADTVGRVAVGSNGKVLKADSTQTAGVGWDYAVPAAGNPLGGAVTYYIQPGMMQANTGTRALSANVRYFYQLYNPTPIVVDQIIWEQTAAAAAGKLIRVGLLLADEWWQPSSVLIDSGAQAADGANGVKAYTLAQATAVPAGRLLAVLHSDGAPTARETVGGVFGAANSTTLGTTPVVQGFTLSTAFAALDTSAWTGSVGSGAASRCAVWLRLSDPTG